MKKYRVFIFAFFQVASASVAMEGGAALNRVTWTQSGLHVAAGDDLGKIWVYDVGEQLAVPQPDEWNKFAHTLQVFHSLNSLTSHIVEKTLDQNVLVVNVPNILG